MKKLTTNEFIEKARVTHGSKFDYSEVDYEGALKKVKILCSEHGIFEQTPDNHIRGIGCPGCSLGQRTSNTIEFIQKVKAIHRDKFDYSWVEYVNNYTKVKILCSEHGIFEQTPSSHLRGTGCPKCSGNRKSNTIEFIERAKAVHGDNFDYSEVEYINTMKKVKILCSQHGIFEQRPNDHLRGTGCPVCAKETSQHDKYKNKPTTLYYLKIGDFFKIGLTQTSIEKRFKKEIEAGLDIRVIKTIEFKDGYEALLLEQKVLQETLDYQVSRKESPIFGGWTEVRSKCFLNLILMYTEEI